MRLAGTLEQRQVGGGQQPRQERRRRGLRQVGNLRWVSPSGCDPRVFISGVPTLGVLTRRNIVVILMSIELILNAVNVNLIAFSKYHNQVTGQVFAIFVIAVAVAEAAVGLGILIALFRNKGSVQADEVDLLKW